MVSSHSYDFVVNHIVRFYAPYEIQVVVLWNDDVFGNAFQLARQPRNVCRISKRVVATGEQNEFGLYVTQFVFGWIQGVIVMEVQPSIVVLLEVAIFNQLTKV